MSDMARRPRTVLVELTPTQEAQLGSVRVALGTNGNPTSAAQAVRAAIEYMAEAIRSSAIQSTTLQGELAK